MFQFTLTTLRFILLDVSSIPATLAKEHMEKVSNKLVKIFGADSQISPSEVGGGDQKQS